MTNLSAEQTGSLESRQSVLKIIETSLLQPANELFQRTSKGVRSQLVRIGYEFSQQMEGSAPRNQDVKNIEILTQIIEQIHTGSLIVDDIQDDSLERRGAPCVHRIFGVPLALNAGNWLYFNALQQLEELSISDTQKLRLYKSFQNTLANAHLGQALDLGANILELESTEGSHLCLKSLEYKTGCLTGLAFSIGAIAAASSEETEKISYQIGKKLGVLLQIFDDIGNLQIHTKKTKSLEDLYLLRPSFVWAYLFEKGQPHEVEEFKNCVQLLPEQSHLVDFLKKTDLRNRLQTESRKKLDAFLHESKAFFPSDNNPALTRLTQIGEKLYEAYN